MNYSAAYQRLMERALTRRLDGYVERHHVVPRCLGGLDVASNKVRLTPEEHYVAHQLLVKMHPDNHRLLWAAVAMTNGTKNQPRKNKLYGWLRRALAIRTAERFRGHAKSDAARAKMSAAKLGKKREPHSVETKAKMSAASKGRKKSAEHCAAMTASRTGRRRGPHSEQHRAALSQSIKRALSKLDLVAMRNTPKYRAQQALGSKQVWERRKAGTLPYPSHFSPVGG